MGKLAGSLRQKEQFGQSGKPLALGSGQAVGAPRDRQILGPGERKLSRAIRLPSHYSEHTLHGLAGPCSACLARSHEEGQEGAVTRICTTCSGSSPSTATPFTSTSLSPAYNKPRQTGTQNKEGYKDTGRNRGTYPKTLTNLLTQACCNISKFIMKY